MFDGSTTKPVSPPCLILAHPDRGYEAVLVRGLRRLGWDVYPARSGPEARRLARLLEADVVVLHADLPDESGWLTCDKLTREQPLVRVLLVSDDLGERNQALADFVGASALIARADGLAPLVEELIGPPVPASGVA